MHNGIVINRLCMREDYDSLFLCVCLSGWLAVCFQATPFV